MYRQSKSFNGFSSRLCMAALAVCYLTGCGDSDPQFSANSVYLARLSHELGEAVSEPVWDRAQPLLEQAFGTPNSPQIPDGLPESLVSREGLQRAAGPVYSDERDVHFGLYRKHCVRCHGVTGDGRGPAARLLSPYPRDFRLGKFKFKATPIGTKPTRQDIARTLRRGIPGTSMPGFRLLKDQDIEALVDYVIYLTARGEAERSLMTQLAHDELAPEEQSDQGQAAMTKLAVEQFRKWEVEPPPEPARPTGFPLWEPDSGPSGEKSTGKSQALADSIARGEQLFGGQVASCSRCHGSLGDGVVPVRDYDDWTKDWTTAIGLEPTDKKSLQDFLKAGALKPVPISARDLRHGVFRGGSSPEELYQRIVHGIEGTPMPAAAVQPDTPGGLTSDQVWDLVNYCLSWQRLQSGKTEKGSAALDSRDASVGMDVSAGSREGQLSDLGVSKNKQESGT